MSQVDEFHFHDATVDGRTLPVPYPSAIDECPQCKDAVPTPFAQIMDALHAAEWAARTFDQDGVRRAATKLAALADDLT